MSVVIGRKAELAALEKVKRSEKSQFVAVYGKKKDWQDLSYKGSISKQF